MKLQAILALTAIAALAQEPVFFKMAAERMEFEGKTVTGAPYSAQAVTETTQVLADGNRITRKTTSSIARDSMGRTRREQSLSFVGPWATGNKPSSIVSINDPVAGTHYTLEPNSHTAMKLPAMPMEFQMRPDMEGKVRTATRAKLDAERGAMTVTADAVAASPISGAVVTAGGVSGNAVYGGMLPTFSIVADTSRQSAKVESLGSQNINGVQADGKRVTETIPAGAIGNERDINVVSETWYSPELQITVMSKNSDPRSGDVVYTLTNISRAEPDPALFQVPADYKLREEPGRTMTIQSKQP